MSAEYNKPSLFSRALRILGLNKYEVQIIEALRTLATLFAGAPKLAAEILRALPEIQAQIVRLESEIPGEGRGRDRLAELMGWVLKQRPVLTRVATLAEAAVAIRAIATLLVASFNRSGMFPKEDV